MSVFRPPVTPAKTPATPQSVWYARCPTLTAMGLIANRGVLQREFLRENVYIVSVRENSTPSVRQGHLDHTLPNLIREADAATALWANGLNGRSRLLAVGQTWHAVSIVTRPSQGIGHLRDLAGRRLSLPKEAGNFSPAQVRSLRAWEAVLAYAGVATQDIEFAPVVADHPSVPFGDVARREVEALLSGQTDVAILYGAKGIELARSAHLKVVKRFSPEEIRSDDRLAGLAELRALTVDQTLLEFSPDIVTRLTGNLLQAAEWARDFPREALKQAALEGKVEYGDAEAAYGSLLVESAQLGLEPARLTALADLQTWLQAHHLLPRDHTVNDWIAGDVLTEARARIREVA